jgi:hypothetical protein
VAEQAVMRGSPRGLLRVAFGVSGLRLNVVLNQFQELTERVPIN